jgi:hypothetical protein
VICAAERGVSNGPVMYRPPPPGARKVELEIPTRLELGGAGGVLGEDGGAPCDEGVDEGHGGGSVLGVRCGAVRRDASRSNCEERMKAQRLQRRMSVLLSLSLLSLPGSCRASSGEGGSKYCLTWSFLLPISCS